MLALRFRAYDQRRYVTLPEGPSPAQAEVELQNVLADVRRGTWTPSEVELEGPREEPTFHEFASAWMAEKRPELRPGTVATYEWQLTNHLLPYFAKHRLSQITAEAVDRYRAAKVRERDRGDSRLSNESINKDARKAGADPRGRG